MTSSSGALLTLNSGSSSLKFQLFALDSELSYLLGGQVSDIGGLPTFAAHWNSGPSDEKSALPKDSDINHVLGFVLNWLTEKTKGLDIRACAHRIVHGGSRFDRAVELDGHIMSYLTSLIPLAPKHQPHNLAAVTALLAQRPNMRQFACFDTAFHARHSLLVSSFALPADIRAQGVRRYGFHGLSYSWIARSVKADFPELKEARLVAAHLGNGASLCAMKDGISLDTTMGLTTLDGLPMGTRCGALDPGAVLFMQNGLNLDVKAVEDILYEHSGLKGLSGISNDVRVLLESNQKGARFALDYFALKTAQAVAAMAVTLGGLDALIFTGGIGENAAEIRSAICSHLGFLSGFRTLIIKANEERAMALEVSENLLLN